MNTERFKILFAHWFAALLKAVVQGSAVSLKAFFGAAAGSAATGGAIPALNWRQALIVAGFAAIYNAVDFLGRNPLPDEDDAPSGETANTKSQTPNLEQ